MQTSKNNYKPSAGKLERRDLWREPEVNIRLILILVNSQMPSGTVLSEGI
jgi:hypothetical protein